MGRTSIPCNEGTRQRLEAEKTATETWDECLIRLADNTPAPPDLDDAAAILEKLDDIEEQLNTESDTGTDLTTNEIQEAVRMEVRNQLRDFMQ